MLYYSIDHPDPDNNFTVTVVPINGAGPGEDAVTTFQIITIISSSSLSILSLSLSPLLSTRLFKLTLDKTGVVATTIRKGYCSITKKYACINLTLSRHHAECGPSIVN